MNGIYFSTCLFILAAMSSYTTSLCGSNRNLRNPTPKSISITLSPGMVKTRFFIFCFTISGYVVFIKNPLLPARRTGNLGEIPIIELAIIRLPRECPHSEHLDIDYFEVLVRPVHLSFFRYTRRLLQGVFPARMPIGPSW